MRNGPLRGQWRWLVLLPIWLPLQAQPPELTRLKGQLARPAADTTRSRLLCAVGKAYGEVNPDSGVYYLSEAVRVAERSHDALSQARAMCQLAHTYLYHLKDEAKTLEWLRRAIAVAKPARDNLHLAKAYQLMAIVGLHEHIGDPEDFLETAIAYARQANDWRIQSDTYSIMADVYIMRRQYQRAEALLAQALTACKAHDLDGWVTLGLDYCDLLEKMGKTEQATAFVRQLDEATNKLQKKHGEFVYINDMARLQVKLGQHAQGEALLLSGIATEQRRPRPDSLNLLHYYRSLVNLYVDQGDYRKAFVQNKELTEMSLWLQRVRQTRDSRLRMTQLTAALNMEKKERQVAAMALRQKQQQLYLVAASVIAAILVGFVLLLQRSRQRINRQRAELAHLNATKDKLFALLSHDLRSPVASLKNYLLLLDWGALSEAEFVASAHGLGHRISQLHAMLDNLLHWSMTQLGGFKPHYADVPLHALVEEQIGAQQSTALAKGIQIYNQIPPDVVVRADQTHLTIVVRNLLQNALKFTGAGGLVEFSHALLGNQHQIQVRDTGVGIATDRLGTLFQLDKQPSKPGTANETGTGLGLMLVRELLQANHGEVSVRSEPGSGTTVRVVLPNSKTPSEPAHLKRAVEC